VAGIYKSSFCTPATDIVPTIVYTGGEEKKGDGRVKFSIFNKLDGPMLFLDEEEKKSIRTSGLIQTDTIKFLTYKDAYSYFTALNTKWNYNVNNFWLNKSGHSISSIDSTWKGLYNKEKYYHHLHSVVDSYTKETQDGKTLWVIYNFNYIGETSRVFSNELSTNNDESYQKLMEYFKVNNLNETFATKNELQFDAYNKIPNFLFAVSDKLPFYRKGKIARKTVIYNMFEVMPELYTELKAHHYKSVVFSSINITDRRFGPTSSASTELTWTINNYLFDMKQNKIHCYGGNILKTDNSLGIFTVNSDKSIESLYFKALFETIESGK
jgi:hypothetical protein